MALLAEGEMLQQPWQQNPADADVAPLSPGWRVVVGAYVGHELVRHIIQMLVLDRLSNGDLVTAYRLLRVIVASAHLSTPGADKEYAPFGFALTTIITELVKAGSLSATSRFWRVAFDGVLLRVADSGTEIHGAVLDLLLEVCKQLQPEVLAGYLGTLLETTADSRTKREGLREEYNRITVPHTGGGLDTIPGYVSFNSSPHDWSDGFRLVRKQKYENTDQLVGRYGQVVAVGGLRDKKHLWPQILLDYDQAHASRQQAADANRRAEREAELQASQADDATE